MIHLQYIAWPGRKSHIIYTTDHGLPENTEGFSKILDLVDAEHNGVPVAVHCSAGIGRTGVFCVAHSILQKLKLLLWKSTPMQFDVKKSVFRLREDRAGMIQTKEQYVFCYLSLVDRLTKYLTVLSYKNQRLVVCELTNSCSRWFHADADKSKAMELLRGKPEGTWLVRPVSSNEPSLIGCIIFCVVKSRAVVEWPCKANERGFSLASSTSPPFQTMINLIENTPELVNPLYK